jgi:hypothetical protein
MKNTENRISTVEFIYNGEEDKFDAFLKSVIRDYLNEDKISPDEDEAEIICKKTA